MVPMPPSSLDSFQRELARVFSPERDPAQPGPDEDAREQKGELDPDHAGSAAGTLPQVEGPSALHLAGSMF